MSKQNQSKVKRKALYDAIKETYDFSEFNLPSWILFILLFPLFIILSINGIVVRYRENLKKGTKSSRPTVKVKGYEKARFIKSPRVKPLKLHGKSQKKTPTQHLLSSKDLLLVKNILKELEKNIKQIQGVFPDKWWDIVKSRSHEMKLECSDNKTNENLRKVQFNWVLMHFSAYQKRRDWDTLEKKSKEIGFRIERYSEINFFLDSAFEDVMNVNKKIRSCFNEPRLGAKIKITSDPVFTIEDLNWWQSSANSSILACLLYAKKIGLSHEEIATFIKVDLDYNTYPLINKDSVDLLFKVCNLEEDVFEDSKKTKNKNQYKPFTNFYPNGKLRSTGYLNSNGKPEGNSKEYHKNGNIKLDVDYKNGIPHGTYKEYYKNGNIKLDFNFKDGIQHGSQQEFYENGQLSISVNYKNGELHGVREQFYPSGNLETRSNYIDGLMAGVHIYLDEDGAVIEEKIMQDGYSITDELTLLMVANDCEHLIKAGLLKDDAQKHKPGEFNEIMYKYYKKNNLHVDGLGSMFKDFINKNLDSEDSVDNV